MIKISFYFNILFIVLMIGLAVQVDAYRWYSENLLFAVNKYKYAAEGNRLNYLDCAFNLRKVPRGFE